jgi:hypothetical protein
MPCSSWDIVGFLTINWPASTGQCAAMFSTRLPRPLIRTAAPGWQENAHSVEMKCKVMHMGSQHRQMIAFVLNALASNSLAIEVL